MQACNNLIGYWNFNLFKFFKLIFLILQVLSFAAMLPLFQSPLSISTEISSISKRAYVIGLGCVTWALGNMALPLVGWGIARSELVGSF